MIENQYDEVDLIEFDDVLDRAFFNFDETLTDMDEELVFVGSTNDFRTLDEL